MTNDPSKILLVSVDNNLLERIDNILLKRNLQVISVKDEAAALKSLIEQPISLALIDIPSSIHDGVKIFKKINNISPETMSIALVEDGLTEVSPRSKKFNTHVRINKKLLEHQLLLAIDYALEMNKSSSALDEANDRLFQFINKFQDGIASVTMEGIILESNEAFRNMLGYSADELKKLNFRDFTPSKWHEMEDNIVQEKIIGEGFSGLYEKEYRRKDGTIIPIEVNAFLTKNDAGESVSMWAFVRDITDRKRSEDAMQSQLQEVTILQSITAAGSKAETVDELLYSATKILGESLYQENFGIFIYDENEGVLNRHFTYRTNVVDDQFENLGLSVTDGITGRAARTRAPQRIADVTNNPDYYNAYDDTRSEIAVPIIMNNKVFGVINSESEEINHFSEKDEKLLITLANQLATSITKIQLNTIRKQRVKEIAALYDTAIATSSIMDTESLYRKIYEQVSELFPLDTFNLVEYDAQDETIRIAFVMEEGKSLKEWLGTRFGKSESGLIGWVIQQRKPFLSGDLLKEPLPVEAPSSEKPARSWLGVPLITKGRVVGGLSVQAFAPDVFDKNDQRLLESLAAQLASAVDNTQLIEKNKNQIERLEALHDIDLVINSSMDLRVSLNILLDQVIEKLHVDAAVVLLHNPHSNMLEYSASRGFRTHSIEQYKLPIGEGLSGKAAMERHLVKALNLADEDIFSYTNLMEEEKFESYYSVPLIAKGQVKGVLDIFNRTMLNPDQEWFNFLETLGGQAAIAIDNTGLLEDLQRTNIELRLAYDTTLEGWSKALDLRDRETEGHTQRVVDMTLRIAETLGVSEEDQIHIRRGALLHDIGKMGIPDSIMLKPGPLSEEEWEIMRRHPIYANELLFPIEHLRPALDIPYCHHERWDGSGYPQKLAGKDIPIASRIFAVVDVWDALTSDRPYRKAWTSKKTLDYIQEERGKLFDPQIVDIFMKLIKSELINRPV